MTRPGCLPCLRRSRARRRDEDPVPVPQHGTAPARIADGRDRRAVTHDDLHVHQTIYVGHSGEPYDVAIPRGADRWFDIVRWSNAPFWAEHAGVTRANVDEQAQLGSGKMRRVRGQEAGFGHPLGLDDRRVYNIIKQGGNYAPRSVVLDAASGRRKILLAVSCFLGRAANMLSIAGGVCENFLARGVHNCF